MRRARVEEDAGYERLLEGGDSGSLGSPTPPAARGQSAATTDSGKLGVPGTGRAYSLTASAAAPQPQQVAVPAGAAVAAAGTPLDDAPDVLTEEEDAVNLMTVWLGMGVGTLFLSLSALSLGTCAALCAIVGASQHVCSCCRGPDVAGAIKTTHVLALVTTALSGISCAETLIYMLQASHRCKQLYSGEEMCAGLLEYLLFYVVWFGLFSGLSAVVAHKAARLRLLLNPVSNGLVTV